MNRTFRIVYSAVRNALTVVSEATNSTHKKSSAVTVTQMTLTLAAVLATSSVNAYSITGTEGVLYGDGNYAAYRPDFSQGPVSEEYDEGLQLYLAVNKEGTETIKNVYGIGLNDMDVRDNLTLTVGGQGLQIDISAPDDVAIRAIALNGYGSDGKPNKGSSLIINGNTDIAVSKDVSSKGGNVNTYGIVLSGDSSAIFNGTTIVSAQVSGDDNLAGSSFYSKALHIDGGSASFMDSTELTSTNELYTANPISVSDGSVSFAGGDVSIVGLSQYGVNAIVAQDKGSLNFSNDGNVTITTAILDDGLGRSNAIGYMGSEGSSLEVDSSVKSFAVNVYGSGVFNGNQLYANGTIGLEIQKDSTAVINAENFVVNVVAGQNYSGTANEVDFFATFDKNAAIELGSIYGVSNGIVNNGSMTVGADTTTSVTISDGYWNAIGIINDPYRMDHDDGGVWSSVSDSTSLVINGDLAVVASGTANNTSSEYTSYTNPWGYSRFSDTVALISRGYDGSSPIGDGDFEPSYSDPIKATTSLGSIGKTVSLTAQTQKPEGSEETFSGATYALLSEYSIVNIYGSCLILSSSSNSGGSVYGLYAGNESQVTVNSDSTEITVTSTVESSNRPYGIYAEEGSTVIFNGYASIDVVGVGKPGAWGHSIDSRSGSTVSFNDGADISNFQEKYTSQTLTARKGSSINFAGNGDVVIEASSPYGSTAVVVNDSQAQFGDATQNGSMTFNNSGTVTVNAGYASSADAEYDSTGFLTTNAVALLLEKGTVEMGSDVMQVNINTYGQGTDYDGTSYSDGSVGIFIANSESSLKVNSQSLNINVLAEASPDATAEDIGLTSDRTAQDAYGLYANAGIIDISAETSVNVRETRGTAYGIYLTGSSTQAAFTGPLTIAAQGNTAAYGIYVDNGLSLTLYDANISATASSVDSANAIAGSGSIKLTGQLTTTGSLANYTGALTLADGSSFALTNGQAFGGSVTVSGGYFNIETVSDVEGTTTLSSGSLQTSSDQIFTTGLGTEGTATDAVGKKDNNVTLMSGTLVLDDEFFNVSYVTSVEEILGNSVSLSMLGTLTGYEEDQAVNISDLTNSGALYANVTGTTNGDNLVVGTSGSDVDTIYHNGNLGLGTLELKQGTNVTVTGDKSLTLVGNGIDVASTTSLDGALTITVGDDSGAGTLNLGHESAANGGTIDGTVDVQSNGTLNVTGATYKVATINTAGTVTVNNGASLTGDAVTLTNGEINVIGDMAVGKLSGTGAVNVGNSESAGSLTLVTLEDFTGTIFLDPVFVDGVGVDGSSSLSVADISTPIQSNLVAGQNSIISLGASVDTARSAFDTLSEVNDLIWGGASGITAAAYVDSPIIVTSGIVVDGSRTMTTGSGAVTAATVHVASNGMLMLNRANASVDDAFITGTVTLDDSSYLGLINATEGEFTLATMVNASDLSTVVTDNPFYVAEIDGNKVVTSQDTANGVSSIASAGIQAMTHRADFVFAQTIADRTSVDQELQPGVNMWVDVAGGTYGMDGMGYDAEFEADVFYGAFGGAVALGQNYTLGAAFQYGTGSLRGGKHIKNEVDTYGFALYGTAKFGAAKIVGELAYTMGENDITATQSALNQSVDTDMYSVGVTGMYEMKAGPFSIVPSIGIRISRLETDAMTVGDVKIDDQDQTLVQVPIALRINGSDMGAGGWKLAPSFKIAYVPTFGDDEIDIRNVKADVIDTNPVQMDFGVRAGKDNLLINAGFSVGAGAEGSSSVGGKVGLKYVF